MFAPFDCFCLIRLFQVFVLNNLLTLQLYHKFGQPQLAVDELLKELEIYTVNHYSTTECPEATDVWQVHDILAQAYDGLNQTDKEIEHYEIAISILVDSTTIPPEVDFNFGADSIFKTHQLVFRLILRWGTYFGPFFFGVSERFLTMQGFLMKPRSIYGWMPFLATPMALARFKPCTYVKPSALVY